MSHENEVAVPPPLGWIEALKVSEAQLAAGHVVDGTAMRQRLRDSIADMETAQAKRFRQA